jgi:hypothetical protein
VGEEAQEMKVHFVCERVSHRGELFEDDRKARLSASHQGQVHKHLELKARW